MLPVRGGSAGAPCIFVGCDDGRILVLDRKGVPLRRGRVTGRPTCLETTTSAPYGLRVLAATDRGEVTAFTTGR
jgi:hypothetical protein